MNYEKVVNEIFSQIHGVRFDVRLWNDKTLAYGQGKIKAFTLVFVDELSAKRLISQGALGFGESYMEGKIVVEGDLEAYMKLRHQFKTIKPSLRLAVAALLSRNGVPSKRKDQISYHYDLGNDFFKLFLDHKTMSYSAGLYKSGSETLAVAQQNKIRLVCDWLDLPKGASVLDLGSGWGGFATYAAQNHKWKLTCATLSKEQLNYCQELVNQKSLQKSISIQYSDMIDNLPAGQFDAIVVLEAIEHVGQRRLEPFVRDLYKKLKPGGVVYIQTTGRYKPKQVDKWTLKYVFPGGYLPSKPELIDAAESAGFELDKFFDDTRSYVITMTEWIKGLEKNKSKIEAMFDPSFYRLWELWMHGAKVAFEVDSMNLFRIKLRKPQ